MVYKGQIVVLISVLTIVGCKDDYEKFVSEQPDYFHYDGFLGGIGGSTVQTSNGDLLLCGRVDDDKDDLLIHRITRDGSLIWTSQFLLENSAGGIRITETSRREIFVCTSIEKDNEHYDPVLIKLNELGDTLWTSEISQIPSIHIKYIICASDNSLVIAGDADNGGNDSDLSLFKVDYDGNLIWSKVYATPFYETVYGLIELQDNHVLLTGHQIVSGQEGEMYLLNVDPLGNVSWDKAIGPGFIHGFSTAEDNGSNLLTCGYLRDEDYNYHAVIVKIDAQGNEIWRRTYGEHDYIEVAQVIKLNQDGDFVVGGYIIPPDSQTQGIDPMLFKIDSEGSLEWCHFYIDAPVTRCNNLIIDFDNINILTGSGNGMWMARIDENGNAE